MSRKVGDRVELHLEGIEEYGRPHELITTGCCVNCSDRVELSHDHTPLPCFRLFWALNSVKRSTLERERCDEV